MRKTGSLLFVLLLSLDATALPQNATKQSILGTWIVSQVLCSDCDARKPAEIGTSIELAVDRIVNPVYGNCDAKPGYDLLKEVSSKELLAGPAKHWPMAGRRKISAAKKALFGFVTCDGGNYMQVAFLSKRTALYVYEGGILFVLRQPTENKQANPSSGAQRPQFLAPPPFVDMMQLPSPGTQTLVSGLNP